MKSCPRCGKQYPDTERFCESDGTGLVATANLPQARQTTVMSDDAPADQLVECPVCGGKALPGEVRCNFCGARLRADEVEPAPALSSPDDEARTSPGSTRGSSGPREFGDAGLYPTPPDASKPGRRFLAIVGFSIAAIVALAAGAWFALYLGNRHQVARVESRSTPAVASAPTVQLAEQAPLQVQADGAGASPRDLSSLHKVFADNKAGLANVYTSALGSDPGMSDGMMIRLHILPNGSVDNGAVRLSTSGNPSFDAEVIEAMTSWKFADVKGPGVTADYRVIFAPSASAASAVESDLNTKLASLSPSESPEYAFSPSGSSATAVAEASPSGSASPAAGTGTSAMPGSAVGVGTPAASEPTTVAAIPPGGSVPTSEATPAEIAPTARPPRRHRRPPREMAALPPPSPPLIQRVNSELRADRRLRHVQAYTNGSVVTIFGKVFDDNDRALAERTVRNTSGVSTVINNVTTDTQQWEQNQNLITQALQNAGLDKVQVKVIGRDAYLSGQVKNDLDKEKAVTVAQAAAPVRVRENLITVAIGNMFGF